VLCCRALCLHYNAGLCAGAAAWARNVNAAYPQDRYIAQKGYGADMSKAQAAALSALAAYFDSEVSSSTKLVDSARQQGNVTTASSTSFDQTTYVTSQVSLFGVRYAEAYRGPNDSEYQTVAYIDRDEAWRLYEPKLRSQTGPFMAVYEQAERSGDPVTQYYRYAAAADLVLPEFTTSLDFAQILHPQRAATFAPVRTAIAGAAAKSAAAKSNAAFYFVPCSGDTDGAVTQALSRAFSERGYKVVRDEALSSNWCEAAVTEDKQETQAGTFYTLSLSFTLYGSGGAGAGGVV